MYANALQEYFEIKLSHSWGKNFRIFMHGNIIGTLKLYKVTLNALLYSHMKCLGKLNKQNNKTILY